VPEARGHLHIYRCITKAGIVEQAFRAQARTVWMSFSENYLKHLEVLVTWVMTGIDPGRFQCQKDVPNSVFGLTVAGSSTWAHEPKGKTCMMHRPRTKDGPRAVDVLYNICAMKPLSQVVAGDFLHHCVPPLIAPR